MTNLTKNFWFFIDKEIIDITCILQKQLDLCEYYTSDEDTWEWCESKDRNGEIYFDISREHNQIHSLYTCPVIFIYRKNGKELSWDDIKDMGITISKSLGVTVFYGIISYTEQSNYLFKIDSIFVGDRSIKDN